MFSFISPDLHWLQRINHVEFQVFNVLDTTRKEGINHNAQRTQRTKSADRIINRNNKTHIKNNKIKGERKRTAVRP